MEEMLDVFDRAGRYVKTITKREAHTSENGNVIYPYFHKNVHIWIVNENTKEVLVQKRAACKKTMPNFWDISSAGHVQTGEDLLPTCQRETEEELGLKFPIEKFKYQGMFLFEEAKEFTYHYIVNDNTPTSKMTLQIEEVANVKWMPFNEFKKFFYSTEFCPYLKDYKDFVFEFINKMLNIKTIEK